MDAMFKTAFAASRTAEAQLYRFLDRNAHRRISSSCIRARAAKNTKSRDHVATHGKSQARPPLQYKYNSLSHFFIHPIANVLTNRTPTRKPPSSASLPKANPLKNRTIPIVLGSITLFALTSYSTYLYVTLTRSSPSSAPTTPAQQEDVSSTYDAIAPSFDSHVDLTESSMGITSMRRDLARRAWGDVLEVSIGTGRNLGYYNWPSSFSGKPDVKTGKEKEMGKVRSFTAVDKSKEMLEIAHDKFSALFPGILGVRWVVGDASFPKTIPPPPKNANERSGHLQHKKYDTIVQTMGLCSVADPVALLRNLGDHVVEEEGRILLLEHGRSKWDWLNRVLDNGAEEHARKFGCWWNRDFEGVIRECGLEVVKVERPKWWHGGTTWVIELKKGRGGDGKR